MRDETMPDASQRPVVTQYRDARRARQRRRSTTLAIGVLGVVALLALGVAFAAKGARLPFGFGKQPEVPAASASTSATAPAPVAAAVATATQSQPALSSATRSDDSAESSGALAWRDADPSWMKKYRGKIVDGFKTEPGYKAVALTFDDGPNGETQKVIDAVSKVDGQATFFFTGRKLAKSWAVKQPEIIWNAGFELANHTQHHTLPDGISALWHRSYETCLAEINGPDVYAKRGTGRKTLWVRPMGGNIDSTGVKAANDTGHLVINWTIDSNDSHDGPHTPDYIYEQCTTGIKSGDVILLHVTHPESMEALPRIVATLTKKGFKLVTVTELAQHSTSAITQRVPE
jgi:peptidoglycan/xylan/chitin deacetylase (PgdA/CDA1 family)